MSPDIFQREKINLHHQSPEVGYAWERWERY